MRIYCWPSEVCGAISPKASGVVFASEWVGAGGGFLGGGCIHSLLDGEKCSAAEMHSKVGESCMGSTTIRFFGWAAALAQL